MLSLRAGRSLTFEDSAEGYLRGEGIVVATVELVVGNADWTRERARMLGSAVLNNGRTATLTAPSGPAQAAVVRRALDDAALATPATTRALERGAGGARRRGGEKLAFVDG